MKQILAGIRVLDLSRVLAGPWATQMLADFGAEVIKVERPGSGDDTRRWGPPWLPGRDGRETREATYFLSANRGKKSLALDIAKPRGQAIARALAAKCDVVVENFKVGDLKRYGLDCATLAAADPRLIYCSITGFGQSGPFAERPGYDFMIQAMGGLMSVTGERDDLPGGGPQKVGVAVADLFTGLYSANAIVAALFHRQRTGEGQFIDMALLDCQVAMLGNLASGYLATGMPPARVGNAHQSIVPYQVFRASDAFFVIAVGNDTQFARLCEALGRGELVDDARFSTNARRVENRDAMAAVLAETLAGKSAEHWLSALEAADVPCGPINDLAQVFAHPQVRHRGMVVSMPRADAGDLKLVPSPIKFSATPVACDRAPPRLGEHTGEVLGELLGMTPQEVAALRSAGIVG